LAGQTYDGPAGLADRVKSVAVTGGVGAAVPGVSYGYDPSTGLPTTTTSDNSAGADMAGTLTQGYDDFGNPVSFTDAGNATTTTSYDSAGRPVTITYKQADGTTIGTTTLAYNGGNEHRGLPTSLTDTGLGGSFTGSYDGNGQLTSQTWPDGLTSTYTYDPTGAAASLTDTKNGNVFLSDQQISTIHGQWASESGMLLPFARDYTYDGAGRLVAVADTSTDPLNPGCTTRTYSFDVDSNRTSKTTYPAAADGSCTTTTSPTTISASYDNADRLQPGGDHTGLTYDAYGRITTLPATDGNGTTTSIGYYVTDMVHSTSQGSASRTWTLDPAMRLRAMTAEAGNPTATVNHYADPTSDSPAWTADTTSTGTTTTWNIPDLTGGLAATLTSTTATWQLAGLHGDIERTTSPTATLAPDGSVNNVDEYGAPTTTTNPPKYGYLGTQQRANDPISGLTYMGVRVYAPGIGCFLQADPLFGGNANAYGYPSDPLTRVDISGAFSTATKSVIARVAGDLLNIAKWVGAIWFCGWCDAAAVALGVAAVALYLIIGYYISAANAAITVLAHFAFSKIFSAFRTAYFKARTPIYAVFGPRAGARIDGSIRRWLFGGMVASWLAGVLT